MRMESKTTVRSVAFNVPVPEWSQRGQSGVPVASDQRWSRAATHQGKWYGGPSETQVSSNSVNSERRMLTECSERVMVWYDSGESSDSGKFSDSPSSQRIPSRGPSQHQCIPGPAEWLTPEGQRSDTTLAAQLG